MEACTCDRMPHEPKPEVGAVTEGNISSIDRKDSYYFIYFLDMFKNYQREINYLNSH